MAAFKTFVALAALACVLLPTSAIAAEGSARGLLQTKCPTLTATILKTAKITTRLECLKTGESHDQLRRFADPMRCNTLYLGWGARKHGSVMIIHCRRLRLLLLHHECSRPDDDLLQQGDGCLRPDDVLQVHLLLPQGRLLPPYRG